MTHTKRKCPACKRTLAVVSKNFLPHGKSLDGHEKTCVRCKRSSPRARVISERRSAAQRARYERQQNGNGSHPPLAINTNRISESGRLEMVTINGTLYLPITAFATALGVPESEVVALINS